MKNKLIYIVDDEEDILDILAMLFEKYQFEVKAFLCPTQLLKDLP